MIINCLQCNREINLAPSLIKQGRKCCSHNCSKIYLWSENKYREHMSLVHKGKTSGKKGKKLSETTKKQISISLKGRVAWNKGFRSIENTDIHHGTDYVNWVKNVKKRDEYKCKINNKDCNEQIEAHHILSWRDFIELRYNINNGITLCHFHHPRKHIEEKRLSPYFTNLILKQ